MMFVTIVLYLLRKDRVYAAAFFCLLATALRPTAVALAFVVVMWGLTRSWHLPKGRLLGRVMLLGIIAFAGGCAYEGYLWHRYDRFDAYKASEDLWDLTQDTSGATTNSGLLNIMRMEGDAGANSPAILSHTQPDQTNMPRRNSVAPSSIASKQRRHGTASSPWRCSR